MALVPDFMVSYRPELEVMLNSTNPSYKVLVYSGQLDVIIGAALTERFLPFVNFPGKEALKTAEKKVWWIHPSDSCFYTFTMYITRFSCENVRNCDILLCKLGVADQSERRECGWLRETGWGLQPRHRS